MSTEPSEIRIHRSRGKLTALAIMSWVFAVIGVAMFLSDRDLVGLLVAGFFGLIGLVLTREARKSEPALILNATGISDTRSHLELSWQEVTSVDKFSYWINFNRQSFLRFEVSDYEAVVARIPARWQQRIGRVSRKFGAKRFYIALNMLEKKPDEIVDAAERFRREFHDK